VKGNWISEAAINQGDTRARVTREREHVLSNRVKGNPTHHERRPMPQSTFRGHEKGISSRMEKVRSLGRAASLSTLERPLSIEHLNGFEDDYENLRH